MKKYLGGTQDFVAQSNRLHDFLLLNFTEFICRKMNGDTPISGKSMVGESVVEASRKWVGEVFQDGLIMPKSTILLSLVYWGSRRAWGTTRGA